MRHRQHRIDITNCSTLKNVKQRSSPSTCARERSNCFTGVVLNHTHSEAKVTQDLFKLEFLESPDYFKPGLPYHGKVRHRACVCACNSTGGTNVNLVKPSTHLTAFCSCLNFCNALKFVIGSRLHSLVVTVTRDRDLTFDLTRCGQ